MKLRNGLTIFVVLLILISNVHAFGLSMPYWDDNPLYMSPGEKKVIALSLQSSDGENVGVKFELKNGGDIAKVIGHDISKPIPVIGGEASVDMEINIPKNTPYGTKYTVEISVKTGTLQGEGMVQLSNSLTRHFDVIIAPPEPVAQPPTSSVVKYSSMGDFTYLIIGMIVIAIIIGFYLFLKTRKAAIEQLPAKSANKQRKKRFK
jgi:hypothetical protein